MQIDTEMSYKQLYKFFLQVTCIEMSRKFYIYGINMVVLLYATDLTFDITINTLFDGYSPREHVKRYLVLLLNHHLFVLTNAFLHFYPISQGSIGICRS